MNIDKAIRLLEEIKKTHGNIKLMSYVQTSADSYRWQDITHLVPATQDNRIVVEVFTG